MGNSFLFYNAGLLGFNGLCSKRNFYVLTLLSTVFRSFGAFSDGSFTKEKNMAISVLTYS